MEITFKYYDPKNNEYYSKIIRYKTLSFKNLVNHAIEWCKEQNVSFEKVILLKKYV